MRKISKAGSLAEISLVRSVIIGRRDENLPYEHASPVAETKCSVLIGCQFSHVKPGHILSRYIGYLADVN